LAGVSFTGQSGANNRLFCELPKTGTPSLAV